MKVKFKEAFRVKEDGSLDLENMTPEEQKKFKEALAEWRKSVKVPHRLDENLLTDWRAIPDTYDPETLFTESLKHRSPITLREYTHWEEYGDGYQNRYGDFEDEENLYQDDDFSDTDEYVDGLDFYGDESLENGDFYDDEEEDSEFDEMPEDDLPQIGDSIIYPEDDDEDIMAESRVREAEEGPFYAVVDHGSIGSPLWAHGPYDSKAEASERAKEIRRGFSATDRNYYHAWCRVFPQAWVNKMMDKGALKISGSRVKEATSAGPFYAVVDYGRMGVPTAHGPFNTKEEANEKAKEIRSRFSTADRKYYGAWCRVYPQAVIDKQLANNSVKIYESKKHPFKEAGRNNKYNSAEVLMYFETREDRDKAFSILLDHDEDVYKCDAHYTPAFPGSEGKKAIDRAIVIYADLFGSYDITQKDIIGKDKAGEDVVVPIKHTKYVGMDEEVGDFVEDMESLLPVKVVDFEYRGISEDWNRD